jgi:hypothetical protein
MVYNTEYTECQALSPLVRIGSPRPSLANKCCPSSPPPLWFQVGEHTSLREMVQGGANSDEGTDTLYSRQCCGSDPDPHHFGNPDPDPHPHQIKIRIRIRIKVIS